MKTDVFDDILKDERLLKYSGIKYIFENAFTGRSFLLFFVSPEVELKTSLMNDIVKDYIDRVSETEYALLNLLTLNLSAEELLSKISEPYDETALNFAFAYFAQKNTLPDKLINILNKSLSEKTSISREYFLINVLLSSYYLKVKNFSLVEKHIKYCTEYIKHNFMVDEFETLVTYLLCARYLENKGDIFLGGAENYYNLAEKACIQLDDKITLASILISTSYYFQNIENKKMAVHYGHKALKVTKSLELKSLDYNIYKCLGILYLNLGNYDNSSKLIKNAVSIAYNLEDFPCIETSRLLNTLGYVHYVNYNIENSITCYLEALKELSWVDSVADILDESIKTFHNLSYSFKMIGDVKNALYFLELCQTIISNTNLLNSISVLFDQSVIYTDLGLLHGLFLDNYDKARYFYELALANQNEKSPSLKHGLLLVLECYIKYKSKNKDLYYNLEKTFDFFKEYDKNNVFVQDLIIYTCVYFSKVLNEESYLLTAEQTAKDHRLWNQYEFYKDYFIENKTFKTLDIDLKEYPIHLILNLSNERKQLLQESRKAKYFDLLQDFSNSISSVYQEAALYEKADVIFRGYFLSKGFIALKHNLTNGFSAKVHLNDSLDFSEEEIAEEVINFLTKKNIPFNLGIRSFDVFHQHTNHELKNIKSMITYYISDDISSDSYYFVIFNDSNCDWIFTEEDGNTGLTLIKALFMKLKNIEYTDSIRNTSLLDSVTGLYNAKYFWSKFEDYYKNFRESGILFSMAIIDLNDFKQINDTYGHSAGDDSIRIFSQILKTALAPYNEIVRYGGDEFIVIFPGIYKSEAMKYILKVKTLCEKHNFTVNNTNLEISFAFGLDTISFMYNGIKDFFNRVDKLMYHNKNLMKNNKEL